MTHPAPPPVRADIATRTVTVGDRLPPDSGNFITRSYCRGGSIVHTWTRLSGDTARIFGAVGAVPAPRKDQR